MEQTLLLRIIRVFFFINKPIYKDKGLSVIHIAAQGDQPVSLVFTYLIPSLIN